MVQKYFEYLIHHHVVASPSWLQAAELAPSLQTDLEVKDAIQGAIQGENGEVVQIVSSVATWGTLYQQAARNCHLKRDLKSLNGTAGVNRCINASSPVNKGTEENRRLLIFFTLGGNVHKELEKIKNLALTGGSCH